MIISDRLPRETSSDYALRVIKENIVKLELKPGCMVSETELAQSIGTSRTPVREAVIELARVKMIEVSPQRGSCISLVDYRLVDEASFLRDTVECAIVERCCASDISEFYPAFEENLMRQRYFAQSELTEKLWDADNSFHRMLFEASDTLLSYQIIQGMTIHMDRIRFMSMCSKTPNATVGEHEEIFSAIRLKNAVLARKLMHQHLTRYRIDKEMVCENYPIFIKKADKTF